MVTRQLSADILRVQGQAVPHVRQIVFTLILELLDFHGKILAKFCLHNDHMFENQAKEEPEREVNAPIE